jgi:ComF family protein
MPIGLLSRLLWPARCSACDVHVPEGDVFCESCACAISWLEPTCPGCGLPLSTDTREDRCPACCSRPQPYSRVWPVLAYGGSLAEAILHLKHGRRRHLARPLGMLLAPAVAKAIDAGVDTLCPVPLHPRRLRERGFNQALDLLRAAERMGRRPGLRPTILSNNLRRVRDTPSLGLESPASRQRIVAGAFVVHQPERFQGRRVLLVDDVMTTGATLAECSRVLRRAGAADVQVTALARAH